MGKNSKIVCTLVPNGFSENGKPKISVHLSPRLPDTGSLKEYYEILRWYEFIDFFRNIDFTTNNYLKVRLGRIDYNAAENNYTPQIDSAAYCPIKFYPKYIDSYSQQNPKIKATQLIWSCLFKPDTPIKGWILDEGEYEEKTVFLYDRVYDNVVDENKNEAIAPKPDKASKEPKNKATSDRESRTSDVKKAMQADISANIMHESEIIEANKENQEFHRKMSILGSYPHLLRACYWILDFELDMTVLSGYNILKLSGFDQLPDSLKSIKKWKSFFNEIDFKTPWTYFDFESQKTFIYKYAEKYQSDYFTVEQGFMVAKDRGYSIKAKQFERDNALANMSANLVKDENLNAQNFTNLDAYIKESKDNVFVSEGISISINLDLAKAAIKHSPGDDIIIIDEDKIKVEGKDNAERNINNYIIFGHHLDMGYEVFVSVGGQNDFHSLCERTATYEIDVSKKTDKKKMENLLCSFHDQSWISEVAAIGKTGKIYFNEEICRWNNWSLVCPQLGSHPQDEKVQEGYFEYNDLELRNIRPTGKLTALRFENKYDFLIKVVDICGNRIENAQINSMDKKFFISTESAYKRKEKVNPFEIYFVENPFDSHKVLLEKFLGESSNLMAVRSRNGLVATTAQGIAKRSISAPRVSVELAAAHEKLNPYLKDKEQRKLIYNKAGYEKDENEPEFFTIGKTIPFIVDPTVSGIEVFVEFLDTQDPLKQATISFGKDYIERSFLGINLYTSFKKNDLSSTLNTIDLHLQPGIIAKVELKPILENNKLSIENTIIYMAHAIEIPMLKPDNAQLNTDLSAIYLEDREPIPNSEFDKNVLIKMKLDKQDIFFPFSSSSEIDLVMNYTDIVYDPTNPEGFRKIERQRVKTFNNMAEERESIPIVSLKIKNDNVAEAMNGKDIKNFTHSFEDTKHRKVNYSLEAKSRFSNFFLPDNLNNSRYIKAIGEKIVKNSKKLSSPVIDSIVHIFDWDSSVSNQIKRENTSFRVYFKDIWYESGEGEEVAVIFNHFDTKQANNVSDSGTVPEKLENIVSSFGADPTTKSKRLYGLNDTNFHGTTLVKDVNYQLLNFTPQTVQDTVTDKTDANLQGQIHAAIYPLHFSMERKQFFVDLKVNFEGFERESYMPFLKFALCKHQKNSIEKTDKFDLRFSPVTMAPPIQMFPPRRISVKTSQELEITIDMAEARQERKNQHKSEFYLLLENEIYGHNISKINTKTYSQVYRRIEENEMQNYKVADYKTFKSISIEEYEVYDVLDQTGHEFIPQEASEDEKNDLSKRKIPDNKVEESVSKTVAVPPNHDLRKRLVFSYSLKS